MIVKNEASCIERCLDSVLPHIDCFHILDTGSSDNTIQLIYDKLKHLPGHVGHAEWTDFADMRNQSMKVAQFQFRDSYLLFMDASDIFVGDLKQATGEAHVDAYWIQHSMYKERWPRPALVKANLPWYWSCKVHEVLQCRAPTVFENVAGCEIKCNVGQPFQGTARFLRDANLLEGETDPRSVFYRAQSWQCASENDKALTDYRKRAKMKGGYAQEAYVSNIRVHLLCGDTFALHCAKDLDPSRAEAWYYLGLSALKRGNIEQAKGFLEKAKGLSLPPLALFTDKEIYTYKALVCWALLTHDKEAARKVVETPGAEYPAELLELL